MKAAFSTYTRAKSSSTTMLARFRSCLEIQEVIMLDETSL